MRRALAIVAAVLMIAGAFAIRSRTNAKDEAQQVEAGKVTGTLVCATEVGFVCDQLHRDHPDLVVRTEDAGTTYATLSTATELGATKIDAWLVPKDYPAMVEENRRISAFDPALGDPSKVLGRSPAVIVGYKERIAAMAKACGVQPDAVDWKCIGSVAGKNWSEVGGSTFEGTVKPGIPPAGSSATGLLVVAQGTAEQLGRQDFATNDFEADQSFRPWLAQLKHAIPASPGATPLDRMLSQGVSTYQVVGSTEAVAGLAVPSSRDKDKLQILYPANVVTADLVVVPVRGSDKGGRVKQLLESGAIASSLAKGGWRVDGQPTVDGVGNGALPDGDGLPPAGALVALIDEWATA